MAKGDYDCLFKLLIVGDDAGKTSIIKRFSEDSFKTFLPTTAGADFKIKTIDVKAKRIKLQIWDTGSLDRYIKLATAEFHNAMGIILVYDITNKETFFNLPKWLRIIDEHAHDDVEKMIIGNKCDMEEKRQVAKEKGETFARDHGMLFMETSAKENINIACAFQKLAETILDNNGLQERVKLYTELYDKPNPNLPKSSKCI